MTIEKKLELPVSFALQTADKQDLDTLEALSREPMETVKLPFDKTTGYKAYAADGTVTLIAATVNLNGTQWVIPADVPTQVPLSVYKILVEAAHQKELIPQAKINQCLSIMPRRS